MEKTVFSLSLALLLASFISLGSLNNAQAAGDSHIELPEQEWHFSGFLGTYDKATLQRGLQVYREVCAACHSMKRVHYRNLTDLGYSDDQVKSIAAEYMVEDGPNDEGEMFSRSATPADPFVSPYPNEKAARYANNGAFPPDLSLITKARVDGPNYVYGLLTGYSEPEHGEEGLEGQYYNKYFSGHWISMAPPLMDGQVMHSNGEMASLHQASYDVVNFLQWAAEPELNDRKRMGWKVIIFLLVFAAVLYKVKKKIWSDVH